MDMIQLRGVCVKRIETGKHHLKNDEKYWWEMSVHEKYPCFKTILH